MINEFRYYLYLQKCNGYWEKEPYETLEEIQPILETLDENEYWWYLIVDKSREKGDETIGGGRVYSNKEYKTRKRKGR